MKDERGTDRKTVELRGLIGKYKLSGVDRESLQMEGWWSGLMDCDVIRFRLDGTIYTAVEDPEDGYRSMMKEIFISNDIPIKNAFPEIEVIAKMRADEYDWCKNDILELIDTKNNKLVLAVGTECYDDYYPCFVAEYNPQNMSTNA